MINQLDHMPSCLSLTIETARSFVSSMMFSVVPGVFVTLLLTMTVQAHELHDRAVTIKVGVRDDAKPFSYIDITRDSESILAGYGGYSIEVCRHVLKQMQTLPRYEKFTFKAEKISARERFKQLGVKGKLFMLCGPDSISPERLLDYRSTHAVFLTGMTYAYVSPRSPRFPHGDYCDSVIGVVRGTTADTHGLQDIASRNMLMRFDEALDLEVYKTSGRISRTRDALRTLTEDVLNDAREEVTTIHQQAERRLLNVPGILTSDVQKRHLSRKSEIPVISHLLTDIDEGSLDKALEVEAERGIGLANKIIDLMRKKHELINAQVAQEIITDECPQGFTSMPVRKYESHDRGIEAFCKGEVLYYLADYDILKNKTREIADCDIVMNRFTRSREVYGVYFPRNDTFDSDPEPDVETLIDVAAFYADFNHFLLMAMQGDVSVVESIFAKEFGVQQKSEELKRFFDGFKINAQ